MPDRPTIDHRREAARTAARIVVAWIVLAACYFVIPFDGQRSGWSLVRSGISLVLFGALAAFEVTRTARSPTPRLRAIAAIGTLVPLLIVLFAGGYLSISHRTPDAFSEPLDHVSSLYFTITTLGTVGFGDIAAHSNAARLAVSLQILLDLAVIGFVVRLLAQAVEIGMARNAGRGSGEDGTDAGP